MAIVLPLWRVDAPPVVIFALAPVVAPPSANAACDKKIELAMSADCIPFDANFRGWSAKGGNLSVQPSNLERRSSKATIERVCIEIQQLGFIWAK